MSAKSTIEWLDGGATWNCVRGCTPIAPECGRCYARAFAERWRGIPGHAYERGFDPRLVPESLDLPLRWTRPRRIFVTSTSDLFHDVVPFRYVAAVFGVMAAAKRHEFILLTKRPERARRWFWEDWNVAAVACAYLDQIGVERGSGSAFDPDEWPLPNVTIGVSVGTRGRLGDLDVLRDIPAARRMLSAEPLLEDLGDVDLRGIDFVAIGGESGHGARPCDVAWIRSLVEQCRAAAVPAFVKQLGAMPVMRSEVWSELAERGPAPIIRPGAPAGYERLALGDRKGGDPSEWPSDLRVRESPRSPSNTDGDPTR